MLHHGDTMTSMIQGNAAPAQGTPANQLDLSRDSLRFVPDQRASWRDFGKSGVSFDEAVDIIYAAEEEDGDRHDLGVGDLSTWVFGPAPDGTAALAPIPLPGRPQQLVPLRNHAFGQLCASVGAPAKYVRQLPGKLQMACVNHGLRSVQEKSATIRLADGAARAIVSDRYAALDNRMVVDTLRTCLGGAGMLGDVRVRAVATGPSCSLRMTLPGLDQVVANPTKVGDVVEVGLDLLNGELGNRSVSVTPITWRLVCLNGMRRADRQSATRLNHVGDSERLVEAFRDAVPSAIASATGLRERMERAVDRVVDDVLGEFDLSAFGLTTGQSRDVARDVMAERQVALPSDHKQWADVFASVEPVTVWDVANGMTHVAQRQHFDARVTMEEAASRYLLRRTR